MDDMGMDVHMDSMESGTEKPDSSGTTQKSESSGTTQKPDSSGTKQDTILWEKKMLNIEDVINSIKKEFKVCGVSNLNITKEHLLNISSRKDLITNLPLLSIINSITYDNIKCYISKIDKYNYINIIQENTDVPKYIEPHNILMINNFLYKMTPYGAIKYNLNTSEKYNGSSAVNACIEASLIDLINKYNQTNKKIFIYNGIIFQKKNNSFRQINTDKEYKISNLINIDNLKNILDNIDNDYKDLNTENLKENEENITIKLINNLVAMFHHNDISYLVYRNKILPENSISNKINSILNNNDLIIKDVMMHYYHKNGKFNYRQVFLCNDDLYFQLEDNVLSSIKDFKQDFNFSYRKKLPYEQTCNKYSIILDQLVRSDIITKDISNELLKDFSC